MASNNSVHIPVLLAGIKQQLGELAGKKIVDGTFGGGGYTAAFLSAGAEVLGIDKDATAIKHGQELKEKYKDKLTLVESSFANLEEILTANNWGQVDAVVLDLGISSDQLDTPERGFSFNNNGTLDMRMGTQGQTAAHVLNTYTEQDLTVIFKKYADEPKSRKLAQAIISYREEQSFETTRDFLDVIEQVYPARAGLNRRHPAQRIFQAIRIAVNNELHDVENIIPQAASALKVGGKFCVVSFHSLEDRIIKKAFKKLCESEIDAFGRHVKKADFSQPVRKIIPTEAEIENNPRARSAILRVLEKQGNSV